MVLRPLVGSVKGKINRLLILKQTKQNFITTDVLPEQGNMIAQDNVILDP